MLIVLAAIVIRGWRYHNVFECNRHENEKHFSKLLLLGSSLVLAFDVLMLQALQASCVRKSTTEQTYNSDAS